MNLSGLSITLRVTIRSSVATSNSNRSRSRAGAEVDMLIELADGEVVAVEIMRAISLKLTQGFVDAIEGMGAERKFIVIPMSITFLL